MRIYLDTSPIIDYIENTPVFGAKVALHINAPGALLVSSDLALMECLVLPLRTGNKSLVQDYEDFFAMRLAQQLPITTVVFRSAASIRALQNFKTPDSIHLAAAVEARCDRFLTNDASLARFTGITVELVA